MRYNVESDYYGVTFAKLAERLGALGAKVNELKTVQSLKVAWDVGRALNAACRTLGVAGEPFPIPMFLTPIFIKVELDNLTPAMFETKPEPPLRWQEE